MSLRLAVRRAVEEVFRHQPGKHNQDAHAGDHGGSIIRKIRAADGKTVHLTSSDGTLSIRIPYDGSDIESDSDDDEAGPRERPFDELTLDAATAAEFGEELAEVEDAGRDHDRRAKAALAKAMAINPDGGYDGDPDPASKAAWDAVGELLGDGQHIVGGQLPAGGGAELHYELRAGDEPGGALFLIGLKPPGTDEDWDLNETAADLAGAFLTPAQFRKLRKEVDGMLPDTDRAAKRHLPGQHNQDKHGNGGGASDIAAALGRALTGQAALDATPATLTRAPRGHSGDYTGEGLSGPEGMGSVRALSEYEGVEYQETNTFLRGGYRDPETGEPSTGSEDFLRGTPERIAEMDKTMAASGLTADVKVERVVKEGARMFGEQAYYPKGWTDPDFDVQDEAADRWTAGERPSLVGAGWHEKGYSSTTVDPGVTQQYGDRFKRTNSDFDGEPIVMTILVPKGTGGIQLSEMGAEAEILLERDLDFEVVADHGVGPDGLRRIDVVASKP